MAWGIIAAAQNHGRKVSVILHGDEAGNVGPLLEQTPIRIEQGIQVERIIGSNATQHDQVVASRDDADGVQLQKADPADSVQ